MHTVTPHLWFRGTCAAAVDFYQQAFGAEVAAPVVLGPDGKSVAHAMLKLGDSHIMMADARPDMWEQGPDGSASAGQFLYVEDCDELYQRALAAGCEVVDEMMDAFWGDRMGKVKDPYGHCWAIASHKWVLTPDEVAKRQQEWLASLKP